MHSTGFITWFEPERVHSGTYIATTFPEYLLQCNASSEYCKALPPDQKSFCLNCIGGGGQYGGSGSPLDGGGDGDGLDGGGSQSNPQNGMGSQSSHQNGNSNSNANSNGNGNGGGSQSSSNNHGNDGGVSNSGYGGSDALLDLGNQDANDYIFSYLSSAVTQYSLDVLRIDYNIFPGPAAFWGENDEIDRIGMREVKYIRGE